MNFNNYLLFEELREFKENIKEEIEENVFNM